MWTLLQNTTMEDEQEFYLGTNDIFRPDLKQIGNSLYEIRANFIKKDGQSIAPTKLRTPLEQVKERLIEHIENHVYDFGFDPLTNEVVDLPKPKAGSCFMFLSHSLAVALDFHTSHRPSNTVCDVFLALPTQSVIVLSLVDGNEDCPEAVTYSMSVARGVIETLSRFTDEDINSIHGVIPISLLEDAVGFKNRLKKLAKESFHFVPNDSLVMTPNRYEKVLTAFWAGVAERKSVLEEESGDTDGDYLRFLTKEQCIILVENINSKEVEVKCMPGSGATTLMLEVARRLNRLGDTLLVCRSRQERDRLRSVYPSAVAAEDLRMVDLSSCVNIVDETNTVMAQTSGQHWRFTTYPTAVKELESQMLEAEMQNTTMEDEQEFYLGTNDIFRPDLKQIGNSLYEIRAYFIKKDGQSIAPTKLRTPLAQVKERLIEHIENHVYDFGFDPLTNEVVDLPKPKAGSCFMFLSHSLAVALDFHTSHRPSNTVCDVFLALPTQSVIVLSLVDGNEDCPEAVTYSMSVARGVIETLSRFTEEDINSIHGVIPISLLEDAIGFKNRLKKLANESFHFVPNDSLVMTPNRYEKVLTAFWAGVAERKSVLEEESGDTDGDYLRFLTKEQCIILVENINSKEVEVKCMPGSGATTLMLEVARRLNRLGDTLLVCRSRQERDRLRSVYPSAVAAEDLRMVDLSSCVNIVDETNTVMAQTSGQHWRFTTYPTAVKELKSQMLEAEMQNTTLEDEQEFYLGTNDIFRPDLKQIGNSLYEIRAYFIKKDGQSIAPTKLRTPLAQVKERLIEHIENHVYDFGFDPLTNEVVDLPKPKAGSCFMFLSHSLAVALDFHTSHRPSNTVCDVFLALPTQSVIVLSLVDGNEDCPEAVTYSMSVARGVIETLSRFTEEDINSIHGVIPISLLEDAVGFKNRLKKLANESFHFVPNDSLVMTPNRYEKVLTAFWAGVAERKSVLEEESGDTDGDYLRFLTKEQCIILVENINSKEVEVKCMPGSGATTLMLEVARRLNRLGDTLLVCRSRQERDRLRSVYPSAVAAEDLRMVDLSSCVNIVDETNTVMAQTIGQHWRFTTYPTAVKELKSQMLEAEMQNTTLEDEQEFYLGTNDIFRPDLKQIGNSLYEIRAYFIKKDGQSIAPTKLRTPLAQVKERLIEHIENHVYDFGFDPLTNEVVDLPKPKAGSCFMFLSHSLAVALDFHTSHRPSNTVCDVFLALPTQSVIVLSLVDGNEDCPEAVTYSMSVARGVIETLSRFTEEDINSIHGVIPISLLEDAIGFKNRLKKLANESFHFVPNDSLVMTPNRYEKVLTAFWAGVAERKSVLEEESGDTDGDYLRFLTKEQCIILVENINSKEVEVKCMPGSGATTLMLEVARRLNRLGDTLLVCRSRQERDRLRSVYPSAVAAEDLRMVDLSSCVNIVDETNTVMAQTSGQHWRFTTYPTAVKELKSQMLEAEMQNTTLEDEQEFYLGTNDIFRPDLKQIGNSLYEIRAYFIKKDGQSIAPTKLRTPLAQVKERLIEHIENHVCDFGFDPLTNEVVDLPKSKAGSCFMFLSHSLAVALDFHTSHRPSNTVCDVFLALPTQSVIVLSLVDGNEDCPEAVTYSMSVARGVIETLSRFTEEDINSIHGVIPISLLEDAVGFKNRLKKLANESFHFVPNDSLVMTPNRYEKVLTAFWAGVAERKSVLEEESGDTDGDYLRFLTKEQCIILVENINSKEVEVKCMPGSGATTLMLEVARRLNRLGDTLLVCRSRQERDRLRSVYPSAVAAEDLRMVDLSSCVNIVDETNTVMAQTSGQHWRFTTYPTAVKELKSQMLEAEMQNTTLEDEQEFYLGTNDIFRPDLKQIGNSLYEIRAYFIKKDGQSIAPTKLRTPLAQVKERLIEHIENHVYDFGFDPLTNEVVDLPKPKAGSCFMFLSHSLAVALDFHTSHRPSNTVCDVFLALPTQSVIVLSLVDGNEDCPEAVTYSMSVARGVIETLSRFTEEDINSIHGVIPISLLEDAVGFKNRLKKLANESFHFVPNDSLVMTPNRYEKVLTAFWAGVAERKSVLEEESGDTDGDYLRFLTKEQCIILVENINSKEVEVKCMPGSGATTLMLEVARRLNRLGDTLLVCRSRQERDRLRSVYPSAVAAEDLRMVDLSSCVNIVDETNTVMAQTIGQHWRFTTYPTAVKELKSQMLEAEMQNTTMEDEQEFYLGTNDIFRPDLKQIGNSLYEIRAFFIKKDGQSIAPTKLRTPLAQVKERLIEHIENHVYDFGFDPLTNEVVDLPKPKAGSCFMFLSHSLAVALDFHTSHRPSNTVCDVFLALPTQSVIVLSLVDGNEDCPEAVTYSMSVARGVIETLSRFTEEDINSIHGVIPISLLEDAVGFKNRLKKLANESFHFVPNDSLVMTPNRYEKVLTAFWAGVAERKSVLEEESGDTDGDYLRFLTKEQCIILVENINSKEVEVKCMPGSGATTLMLEVARRLNRLGDTLLVCRSRQERDRLRSVYPSAVAAEDLRMVDLSSCVNIVDETNTVMAQTIGQHWRFTTYPTAVKELKSQMLEAEMQNTTMEDEQEFYLGTNDIFRPDLKQIGNSLYEIRAFFIKKDGQSIAPTKLRTPLAQVKERLIEHIENHVYDFGFDPLTNEVVDLPKPKAGSCFMFLSHSLAVALDFHTSHRPSNTVCDVFLALPTQSVIVLSLVDGNEDCPEAVTYSMSVARGVIETLSRFTDEDINSIHGVIPISLLEDAIGFKNRLKKLANESFHFVPNDSLVMTPNRYEKVLTAFWAGVAERKSVLEEESGDTDGDYLRFLTKEQCIILVENINSKEVEVKCMPGSGATTLMLEVARRLNRLGDTLLVCRSRQERDRLRSVYPSAVAAEDLRMVDLSSCVNIVDETNTVMAQTSGQHWRFTTYPTAVKEVDSQMLEAEMQNTTMEDEQEFYFGTKDIDTTNTFMTQTDLTDIKELKSQIFEAEMEIEGMEKQIDALSDDSWKERIELILRDFSVLKMFSFKLGSTGPVPYPHEIHHTREYKPSPLTASKGHCTSLGDFKQLSATQAAWLADIHDGLRQRKNLVPLFRSVIIQDKTHLVYQSVEHALLKTVLGTKKNTESTQNVAMSVRKEGGQIYGFVTEAQSTDAKDLESPIDAVREDHGVLKGGQVNDVDSEVQNTDVKHLESRWSDIEQLNQDLKSLLKDLDHRKGRLHELYTVEWQAVMEYLTRHASVLSVLDTEIPGLEFFQSTPDRHGSAITDRDTGVLGTSAASTVGHDETRKHTGTSRARNEQRLHISRSAASQSDDTNDGAEQRHTRAPGLMNQLRQYQQGRLTEKHLCAITMKIIREDELQLMKLRANNDCLEKDYGSTVHVVGLTRRPRLVSCPRLHLDTGRANTKWCHVTEDGLLVNRRPDTRDEGQNRLQKYKGTCSSPIPLPPSSSTLTPIPTTPRYWETETRVRVGDGLFLPILELGVCEAGRVDSRMYVSLQRRSWCVSVGGCDRHRESVCTKVWREGERAECHQNTMSRTPGTQATLHYGVVLDVRRGRVAFIDMDRQVVLDKCNVEFREPLVPMFSVGLPYPGHTSSMSLISGADIDMTDTKKALIYQALK